VHNIHGARGSIPLVLAELCCLPNSCDPLAGSVVGSSDPPGFVGLRPDSNPRDNPAAAQALFLAYPLPPRSSEVHNLKDPADILH
jgi:hypothetical protein